LSLHKGTTEVRDRSKSATWSVTTLYAAGAIAAGVLLPRLEHGLLPELSSAVSIPAATAIYSSIASGMIALTGVVFSLTFVMVQFSSTAYSPRLVLWLSRDPMVAHAFGTFTATFLYAIAALAWVDRLGAAASVPLVSTAVVMALLLASIAMFVGLIRRIARLQVGGTLAFTGDQGRRVIDAIYPTLTSRPASRAVERPAAAGQDQVLTHHGAPLAVQAIAVAPLVRLAATAGAVIEVFAAVGDTVVESTPLMRVVGARERLDERVLQRTITLGVERTFEQDPKYAIRILVDIAIKALSPAVNDPTTAVQALDQIGDLLLRLGRRRLEIGAFHDEHGRLRVLIPFPTWDDFLRLAFSEIRAYGATSVQVMRRMHALVTDLVAVVPAERRGALAYWHERLRSSVAAHFTDPEDQRAASVEDRQGLGVSRRSVAA
jgi:uncharacterized membrane protein